MTDSTSRVVVVASGFGIWIDNQHIASGRWSDIASVRDAEPTESQSIQPGATIVLRDGTEIPVSKTLFGYQAFITAAGNFVRVTK